MNLRQLSETLDAAVNGVPPQNNVERIQLAQELLQAAIGLLKEVDNKGQEGRQIILRLEVIASKDHDCLTMDPSLDSWIEDVQGDEEAIENPDDT